MIKFPLLQSFMVLEVELNRGIKHDYPFINIRNVPNKRRSQTIFDCSNDSPMTIGPLVDVCDSLVHMRIQ